MAMDIASLLQWARQRAGGGPDEETGELYNSPAEESGEMPNPFNFAPSNSYGPRANPNPDPETYNTGLSGNGYTGGASVQAPAATINGMKGMAGAAAAPSMPASAGSGGFDANKALQALMKLHGGGRPMVNQPGGLMFNQPYANQQQDFMHPYVPARGGIIRNGARGQAPARPWIGGPGSPTQFTIPGSGTTQIQDPFAIAAAGPGGQVGQGPQFAGGQGQGGGMATGGIETLLALAGSGAINSDTMQKMLPMLLSKQMGIDFDPAKQDYDQQVRGLNLQKLQGEVAAAPEERSHRQRLEQLEEQAKAYAVDPSARPLTQRESLELEDLRAKSKLEQKILQNKADNVLDPFQKASLENMNLDTQLKGAQVAQQAAAARGELTPQQKRDAQGKAIANAQQLQTQMLQSNPFMDPGEAMKNATAQVNQQLAAQGLPALTDVVGSAVDPTAMRNQAVTQALHGQNSNDVFADALDAVVKADPNVGGIFGKGAKKGFLNFHSYLDDADYQTMHRSQIYNALVNKGYSPAVANSIIRENAVPAVR